MRTWSWLTVFVLAVMLVACAGQASPTSPPAAPAQGTAPAEQAPPTPTPTSTPTPTPVPTPTPEQVSTGETPPFLLPGDVQGVRDFRYRYRHTLRFEGFTPQDVPQNYAEELPLWEVIVEATVNPPARHLTMRGLFAGLVAAFAGTAPAEGESKFPEVEMIQIGDTVWIRTPQGWIMATQQAQYDPEADLQDFQGSLSISGWQRVGSETVNGFETDHYQVEVSPELWQALPAFQGFLQQVGASQYNFRLERVTGDAYVTPDGLLVKADFRQIWRVSAEGQEGRWTETLSFELEGVNLGITIEPPTSEAEVQEPIPLPPGAVLVARVGPLRRYEVADTTLDEVIAFFQEALPANGFTIEQSMNNGQLMNVSKEGKRYMILLEPSGNKVGISITEQ